MSTYHDSGYSTAEKVKVIEHRDPEWLTCDRVIVITNPNDSEWLTCDRVRVIDNLDPDYPTARKIRIMPNSPMYTGDFSFLYLPKIRILK